MEKKLSKSDEVIIKTVAIIFVSVVFGILAYGNGKNGAISMIAHGLLAMAFNLIIIKAPSSYNATYKNTGMNRTTEDWSTIDTSTGWEMSDTINDSSFSHLSCNDFHINH